jgi:hypothetical protein
MLIAQRIKSEIVRIVLCKYSLPMLYGSYLSFSSVGLEIAFDSRPRCSAVANDTLHLCTTIVVNGLADSAWHSTTSSKRYLRASYIVNSRRVVGIPLHIV